MTSCKYYVHLSRRDSNSRGPTVNKLARKKVAVQGLRSTFRLFTLFFFYFFSFSLFVFSSLLFGTKIRRVQKRKERKNKKEEITILLVMQILVDSFLRLLVLCLLI